MPIPEAGPLAPAGPEPVHHGKRGRLKVYIGFAAGVGKTHRMLEEAQALRKRGVEVAIGLAEAHGRPGIQALMGDLEQIPLREVEYRGVAIRELNLDGILRRNPAVVLVDELAHTNAPDGRNHRRYQDVLELLDAGISVIGAFDIRHLESLNDTVSRLTGVKVRETIPDGFLRRADQVVNVDLSVEDLRDRVAAGKIVPPERVEQALGTVFQERNLAHLRELALREVADSVERTSEARPTSDDQPRSSTRSRVMVCLSSGSRRAPTLIRRGSRMVGRLGGDWFVVFVETQKETPENMEAGLQQRLLANFALAKELGAEVVRLRAEDPAAATLDFARSHNVGHVIVGQSLQPWWRQLLGWSFPLRLLREGGPFDIHIVSLEGEDEA